MAHRLDHRSPQAQAYSRMKKTARWQKLRWSVIRDALFTCVRCKRVEPDTSQLVADHIIPHKGDEALFWDRSNLQCLCAPCHNSAKQSQERTGRARHLITIGLDGWPTDGDRKHVR